MQTQADAARGPAPALLDAYEGEATIETYTVFYDRDGAAKSGVIVARTPGGARTLAYVPRVDGELIARLTDGEAEPVGMHGRVSARADGLNLWRLS